ncbi:MAG TPA: PEP/pyruvate-binding domain-containing protein, partial [Gammaproteobacteria bacterium]|nr:PEP/pyruvate-binding domain-containing protein [Gammaproteobacteria bacterium]
NRHLDQHIGNKTDRIAPVQGKGLESVPVDPAKANKAALTPVQARRLHFICEQITAAYGGKPLDIEWVFKDNKFYIVQVRDLPKPKHRIEPAYVTEIDPTKVLTSGTSVVAGCDVRRLDTLDDCIIRDNLADALKYYLSHRDKQAAVKAIFVKEGLQTSHEANYFRYLGIPVIMVKDTDDLRYALQKKNSLTLCCQSGRVYNDAYDNYLNGEKIKEGWFKHPHKMSLNLEHLKLYKNANDETAASYQDTFSQLAPRDTYLSDSDMSFWKKVDGIFTLLRNDTNVASVRELRDLITSAAKAISKQILDRSLRSELATVLEHAWIACDALISIIQDQELGAEDPEQYTLQKLLALQRIETILTQEPDPQLHTQLSFAQILREATEQARIHKIIDTIEPPITDPDIRELLTQGLKASKSCLNLEFKQAFVHYLCHLDRDAMIHTCKMLMDYKRDGILELAVNQMPDIDTSAVESYSKIYAHQKRIHESFYSSELVKQLQKIKNLNSLWRSKIVLWKDAGKFGTLIADFQRFIDSFVASINLLETIKDPLQKQLLINNLKESLDIFDLSLKELSASTDYDDHSLQGKNFSKLLMHYQNVSSELLFSIEGVFEIKAKTQATETAKSEFYTLATLNEHFNEAAKQVCAHADQVNYAGQLAPSGTFDVSKAVFTNSAAPQRTLHGMTTLIDVFTLLHQNALAALALHQNSNMKLRLPEDIQSIIDDVINNIETTHASGKPTFISGTLEAPLLCLTYNYPLRNHSANITLKYDMNNPQHATLQMDLFMQNEGNRCVNTRVLARNFQTTHEQLPIQLQSYNAIESAPTAWQSGTFFANHFIWDIDLANCGKDEDQLTVFANHLGDLLACTFEVPMLDINDNPIDPKEYHLDTYVPGMFNYSFSGLEDVCKNLCQSYNYALMLDVVKEVVDAVNERIVYGPLAELEILYPQFYALAAVFEALDQSPYSTELDSYMEANAQIDLSNLLNIDEPTTFLHMAEFAYTILDTAIEQQDLYPLLLEWLVRHPDKELTQTFAEDVHKLAECYNALKEPTVFATTLDQAREYLQLLKKLPHTEPGMFEKAIVQLVQWKSQWSNNDAKAYNQAAFTYDHRLHSADKKSGSKLEHHYAPDMFDESYSGLDDLLELLEFEDQGAIITRVFYDIVDRLPTMERLRTNTLVEQDKDMIALLKSYFEYNKQDSSIMNTIQTKIHSFLNNYAPITILTPPFVQLLAVTFDPTAKSLILDSIVRSTSALEFMQNIEIFRTTHECTHAEIGILQLQWLHDHPQHVVEFAKQLPRFTLQYITFANKTYDSPDDHLLIMKVCGHLEDWSEMYVGRAFTN